MLRSEVRLDSYLASFDRPRAGTPRHLLAAVEIALQYVPVFIQANVTPQEFQNITDERLQSMSIPEDARRKILQKARASPNTSLISPQAKELRDAPEVNLEELVWEIRWEDLRLEKQVGSGNYGVAHARMSVC